MVLTVSQKLSGAWEVLCGHYDQRMDSELDRWKGQVFANVTDHGWLRLWWRNEGQISEGLYRSNHPNAKALAQWKARGIKVVLSLRPGQGAVHVFEAETCAACGMILHNVAMASREAPTPETLLSLLEVFEALRRPALIHCKSGADRTGLAAAIWLIHVEGHPVTEAKAALGFQHLHIRYSKTGVLDRFLEAYEARLSAGYIPLKQWIESEYDPQAL